MIATIDHLPQAVGPPKTWEELVLLEPRLQVIELELLACRPVRGRRWILAYETLKCRLRPLVGWFRRGEHTDVLCSAWAWEVSLRHLARLLETRPRRRRAHRSVRRAPVRRTSR